ncbi:MBL fold metallo-hydrolase [Marinobacter sp. NFXS9]
MFYLKREVYFEPLINHWYAWPYLLPPAQAARYISSTHLKLMDSFVKNSKLHVIASKQLAGGDFLNCSEDQVAAVSQLIESTEHNHKDILELANAISELDDMLREHSSGESIEPLYELIPAPLKGYVELLLDLEHRPTYRLLEALLYRSQYNKEALQSVNFGLSTKVDERPFVLNTPRIADNNHLHLSLPFNSPKLKKLLASRDNPLTMDQIEDIFDGVIQEGGVNFKDLFTCEDQRASNEDQAESFNLKYTGHAGFLISDAGKNILIDPVIPTYDPKYKCYMTDFCQLPEHIDFVCLTHSHLDHTNIETLLQLRHKVGQVLVPKSNSGLLVDPSIKLMLEQLDFNVRELEDLDQVPFSTGCITAVPFLGEHGDLNVRSKCAWLVDVSKRKLFFGADSSCLDKNMYSRLHQIIGNLDLLAIGMECVGAPYTWLYGALHTKKIGKSIKESRRLNGADSRQAINMVDIFNPKKVCIYALGAEPCYRYFMGIEYDENSKQIVESNIMAELCAKRQIPAKILIGSQDVYV